MDYAEVLLVQLHPPDSLLVALKSEHQRSNAFAFQLMTAYLAVMTSPRLKQARHLVSNDANRIFSSKNTDLQPCE